jgi:hypothetical protein
VFETKLAAGLHDAVFDKVHTRSIAISLGFDERIGI